MINKIMLLLTVFGACVLSACGGGGGDVGGNGSGVPSAPIASSVSGSVVVKNGAALSGVMITAYCTNDHTAVVTTTDAGGNYTLTGLETGTQVNYEIRAEKAGYGFYPAIGNGAGSVVKSDYNGLFRTVISFFSRSGSNMTGADFSAFNGENSLVSLAQTGQVASFAGGDDGSLRKGVVWPGTRFADNQNGTITDNLTGLIWLKNAGCFSPGNWSSALTAANQLAGGSCGLTDGSTAGQWRLPNVNELESLVDVSKSSPALSGGHPFSNVADSYWSSTTYAGNTPEAWVIRFTDGRYMNDLVVNVKATSTHSLWAVKSGAGGAIKLQATGQYVVFAGGDDAGLNIGVPLTSPRFVHNGDGTVTDTVTGLIWLEKADCLSAPWSGAIAAINNLASGQCGLTDGSTAGSWRMPNRAEMLSLADRAVDNQANYFTRVFTNPDQTVDRPAIFTNFITAAYYWTSSTDSADTNQAWTVYSCDFGVYDILKANTGYSLAVR